MLHLDALRRQFPYLQSLTRGGKTPVYLDSAATTQKPQAVIDAVSAFYSDGVGNVHRGMHELSERSTLLYEEARTTVARFINARHKEEIIFTRNATESINLVANAYGKMLKKGDAVVLSILEHHSNIVPWLQLKAERGIEILWIDCDDEGKLKMDQLEKHFATKKVKLLSITGQSNVLGIRPHLREMTVMAHAAGAKVLVDAAQLVAHSAVDVQDLDCDYLAFSGHKLFGPTGIGVLYGKKNLLEQMPPFLGGGMMIRDVTTESFTPGDLPMKFEAGTPPAAEASGLKAAIDWLNGFDRAELEAHEANLIAHARGLLTTIPGLRIIGPKSAQEAFGCVSFIIDGVHPHDLTHLLGERGIALRAGHHCTQPLHHRLGLNATTRLSVAPYNTLEEIDLACSAITEVSAFLRGK